jgi:hypothetical protein
METPGSTETTVERPVEVSEIHTRILRCTLAAEDSQIYWSHFDASEPPARRNLRAFEERWFGTRSQARVKTLLANLSTRFDAHPRSIETLRDWRSISPVTRRIVCHWHLQFVDPLYRRFSAELLPGRRGGARDTIDRDIIGRWVEAQAPERWSASTRAAFGTKLLSTAVEAGLVLARGTARRMTLPRIEDDALAYLLRWLGTLRYEGTLVSNPYLASVGLTGRAVDERLSALPDLLYRRSGDVIELEWRPTGSNTTAPRATTEGFAP